MIKNFDVLKEQLKELAAVINAFKSETVQLRLIELVFGAARASTMEEFGEGAPTDRASPSRRKTRQAAAPTRQKGRAQKRRRPGGKVMLDSLLSEGFFKKPKTINDVVDHCKRDHALIYKQPDFSGALGRLTRDYRLKRTKNADKQYEYVEA